MTFPYIGTVQAGFPSPADDHLQEVLDLMDLVTENPNSTYYAKANGKSMVGDGIEDGDILIVDRSLTPLDEDIVIGFLSGEFLLKRLKYDDKELWLVPGNTDYPKFKVTEEQQFSVWGVVTYILKKTRKKRKQDGRAHRLQ